MHPNSQMRKTDTVATYDRNPATSPRPTARVGQTRRWGQCHLWVLLFCSRTAWCWPEGAWGISSRRLTARTWLGFVLQSQTWARVGGPALRYQRRIRYYTYMGFPETHTERPDVLIMQYANSNGFPVRPWHSFEVNPHWDVWFSTWITMLMNIFFGENTSASINAVSWMFSWVDCWIWHSEWPLPAFRAVCLMRAAQWLPARSLPPKLLI